MPGGPYQAVRILEKRRHNAGLAYTSDALAVWSLVLVAMPAGSSNRPSAVNSLGVQNRWVGYVYKKDSELRGGGVEGTWSRRRGE